MTFHRIIDFNVIAGPAPRCFCLKNIWLRFAGICPSLTKSSHTDFYIYHSTRNWSTLRLAAQLDNQTREIRQGPLSGQSRILYLPSPYSKDCRLILDPPFPVPNVNLHYRFDTSHMYPSTETPPNEHYCRAFLSICWNWQLYDRHGIPHMHIKKISFFHNFNFPFLLVGFSGVFHMSNTEQATGR